MANSRVTGHELVLALKIVVRINFQVTTNLKIKESKPHKIQSRTRFVSSSLELSSIWQWFGPYLVNWA